MLVLHGGNDWLHFALSIADFFPPNRGVHLWREAKIFSKMAGRLLSLAPPRGMAPYNINLHQLTRESKNRYYYRQDNRR